MSTKSSNLYRQLLGYDPETVKKLDGGSAWSIFSSNPLKPDGTLDTEASWENQWMRAAYQEWASKEELKRQEEENALAAQAAANNAAAQARAAEVTSTPAPTTTTTTPTATTATTTATTTPAAPSTTTTPPNSSALTTTPSIYYPSSSSAAVPTSASLFTTPVSASTATGSLGKSINNSNTEVQGYLDTLRNAASSNITSAGNEVSNLNTRFQNANALTNRVLADEKAAREKQAAELRAAELDSSASMLQSFFIEEGARQRAELDQRNLDMRLAEQRKRLTSSRRMLSNNTSGMGNGSFFGSVS